MIKEEEEQLAVRGSRAWRACCACCGRAARG